MTPAYVVYFGLLLARVGTFVAVIPPFATRTPRSVRASFAMILTLFYVTSAAPTWDAEFARQTIDLHPARYALALVRESLLGACIGFAFALFLLPVRIAGEFITQQIGLNAAQAAGPTSPEGSGPLTNLFETAGGLLILITDTHHVVFQVFHGLFGLLPLGGTILPDANPMLNGLTSAYEMGLLLAAPIAICLFLLLVTLAIMTRAAPQLNVYSVGFTLQVTVLLVGGLFLLPEFLRALEVMIRHVGDTLPSITGR
jgi:flagellar biosynthesis protein FliR